MSGSYLFSVYFLIIFAKNEAKYKEECTVPYELRQASPVQNGYPSPQHLPHMAAVGWTNTFNSTVTWVCGGSLITEDTIITAAHCTFIEGKPGSIDVIRLGDVNLLTDDGDKEKAQQYGILKIIRHPGYKGRYNDIALIKLKVKVKLSESVIPACLWMNYTLPTDMFCSGYGQKVDAGPMSLVLTEIIHTSYEISNCSEHYQKHLRLERGLDDKIHLCANDRTGRNMDACQVDIF